MEDIDLNEIIYQLTVEDICNVAEQELDRELSDAEIELIKEKIGNYIDWYESISACISDNIEE